MKPIKTFSKWLADETPMRKELRSHWGGDWGCDSEVGKLKAVLLRRPGEEIEAVKKAEDWRWLDVMDPHKAREQHDALAEIYRSHGVEVHYVKQMRPDRPNALFMRDNVLMTPEGAIVGRQAMSCRRGEERYAAQALAELGVPILRTVSGNGIFETACCLWVDAGTVIMGTGNRANEEGCRQVEEILLQTGVEDIFPFQIPFGGAHIDSFVSFMDEKTAVFDPVRMPWDVWTALRKKGIKLLEAPSPEETQELALNIVALSPRIVLMAAGFPKTRAFLEKHGVGVTEVDVTELRKGWGSLHCMTAVLKRDLIGKIL
ncbi:MAG: amidinotransferase [Candidatus Aminicenantes bacterium]|nr:amidinotransferase [Candidatus Aminicenantes bacterium]